MCLRGEPGTPLIVEPIELPDLTPAPEPILPEPITEPETAPVLQKVA